MKITQVSYRTNIITPPNKYRSKHVEATATVSEGEDPETVLVQLAGWVHEQGISRPKTPALRSLGDED